MEKNILKKKGLFTVPFLFSFFFFQNGFAGDSRALEGLAESDTWKTLLRYERPLLDPWYRDSAIHDDDFFLSPDGRWDPVAEIKANVAAFQRPMDSVADVNQHPLCRFPARYKWLQKKLQLSSRDNDLKKCENYQRWSEKGQVTSISIYFATGYFGNPASFFGHPLLKFNVGEGKPEFIDTSLNYGAMTPEGENPVLYVLKGLFGGYTASFTRHDFFYHNHNYSETEMRDLWEYRLNLDPDEVEYIVDRTWELLGKNHPYYFLVDNCAYRTAELLEEVYKQPVLFRNRTYVIPIDLFDNLEKKTRLDARPMVKSTKLVPSRYTRMASMYSSLTEAEKRWVDQILEDEGVLATSDFQQQDVNTRARIIETMMSYYSFRKLRDKENSVIEAKRVSMIRERFKIPGKSPFKAMTYEGVLPPHDSVNSFGLGLTQGYGDLLGSFQEFTVRPALYDELNPSVGRPDNTSLEVFTTQFRLSPAKLTFRRMDVFRISTLNTSKIALPETGNMAWKMRLGLKSQAQACENCTVAFVQGGVGASFNLWSGTDFYGLVKGGLQNNKSSQGTVYALPEVGVFMRIFREWKLAARYEYEKFFNGQETEFDVYTLESRFGASQWWDLRLSYQKRDDEQISLSLWFYL